jgi:hypothetical protein
MALKFSGPKKQPYIKVKYKVDHPNAGIKAGDVVPIAYRTWANVPPTVKLMTELAEGPETLQDLREAELQALQDYHTKLGEELEEYEEVEEEEEEEDEANDKPRAPKKKVVKKIKKKK